MAKVMTLEHSVFLTKYYFLSQMFLIKSIWRIKMRR